MFGRFTSPPSFLWDHPFTDRGFPSLDFYYLFFIAEEYGKTFSRSSCVMLKWSWQQALTSGPAFVFGGFLTVERNDSTALLGGGAGGRRGHECLSALTEQRFHHHHHQSPF